jgi:hypothetical protein
MRTKLLGLVVALLLAGTSSIGAAATTAGFAGAQPATTSGQCGTLASAPTYSHVIWVSMENHSYDTIIGSPQAPYINSLATSCGLATNYHNISHPSLPNYVGITSGLGLSGLKQFKSDCSPSKHCSTSAASIFGQGESWKAYEESMPSNCFASNSGEYAVRHNPPPYFTSLAGCTSSTCPTRSWEPTWRTTPFRASRSSPPT